MRLRTLKGRFLALFLIIATALTGVSAAQAQGGGPLREAGVPFSLESQYNSEKSQNQP